MSTQSRSIRDYASLMLLTLYVLPLSAVSWHTGQNVCCHGLSYSICNAISPFPSRADSMNTSLSTASRKPRSGDLPGMVKYPCTRASKRRRKTH